jgi:general secretion pathway protein C
MNYLSIHSLARIGAMLLMSVAIFADSHGTVARADSRIQGDSGLVKKRSVDTRSLAVQDIGAKLIGTALSDDPERSLAVIEDQTTGKQGTYKEGDQVAGGAIKKILFGKVIIDIGTGDVVLSMNSGSYANSLVSKPQIGQLDAEEVDTVLPDYAALMREIRVRSYFEGGRLAGFVIYNIGTGSIFERMGLKDGDVIESVNGKFFATTQPVVEFYDSLMECETVTLEILREGVRQGLLFEIQ